MRITKRGIRRFFSTRKGKIILSIIIVAILGIAFSLYMLITFVDICEDESCFSTAIVKCNKVEYMKITPESTTLYRVKGTAEFGSSCQINVKLLQVKKGSAEIASLEGKEMDCFIPLGTYAKPEERIEYCHGELKESIQEIIIQRMHSQLIENLGKISREITEVI